MGKTKSSRSSQSRNKPEPVSEPDSRPPSLLVTTTDTSDSESSAPKKLPTPSEQLSFWLSCLLFQFDEVTGVPNLVNHTPSHARSTPNVVPSTCDSSQLHEVPVSLPPQSQRKFLLTLDTPMSTPVPKVAPPPSVTSLRPPSRLLPKPAPTCRQTSGKRKL